MGYSQVKGRRPFERASKIAHAEVLNNPVVQEFVARCVLPSAPETGGLFSLLRDLPSGDGRVTTVIAIDGGLTEAVVRKEFPSASVVFMTLGPLLLSLADLAEIGSQTFIGPEDMARLKNIERYSFVVPARTVKVKGATSFAEGVRLAVQEFLLEKDGHLMEALRWLVFHGWLPSDERVSREVPRCPSPVCKGGEIVFRFGDPTEKPCSQCGRRVFLSDTLRLYERIDEEQGAGGVMSYLLTTLEQIILVHLIRSIWQMKPSLLRQILFVKDGPLAFFGVTAPMQQPMRALMTFLGKADAGQPLINLVGLEKSGPFVEHATLIEPLIGPGQLLPLTNDYIYRYIQPGDPAEQSFGRNTYYGAKAIFKSKAGEMYVVTIPTGDYAPNPRVEDLFNGSEVLEVTGRLRCSMYDNALLPVVLANRLVSLADVPSSEILRRFAAKHVGAGA